jgi:succinylglutamate desuccinylase
MKSVFKIKSTKPGKTLAVFAGVHGNELSGIEAVKKAVVKIKLDAGQVYFVLANPKAIAKGVRFIDKNLNRCFLKNQSGKTYEEKRTKQLMKILDKTEALLDIHASNNPKTIPFIITDNGFEVVKNFSFPYLVTGFDKQEPGATDGYMKNQNKIGICIECGYAKGTKKNIDLAYDSIIKFLKYFDLIDNKVNKKVIPKKMLHVNRVQLVTSEKFRLIKSWPDFYTFPKKTIVAKDEKQVYQVEKNKVILFASPGKPVGAEAYVLGNWVNKKL